jgi:predicted hotdog family 3-hydroxylacyl-ACP dehydratase
MDMDVRALTIEDVVPHRGAMLLLDTLLAADEDVVTVEGPVRRGQLFEADAGVPAYVGVEYMAQAIAAWAGCRSVRLGQPVKIGFLLGTRRYACTRTHFPFGARLRIVARREVMGDNGLGMFACSLAMDGEVLAEAMLSVFEPPDAEAFLQSPEAGVTP